jgi:hypothetical protein
MKTWLGNYNAPQLLGCVLALFYLIPGIIFAAVYWGKFKCPNCGVLGKSAKAGSAASKQPQTAQSDRIGLIERLDRLRRDGAISQEEFEAEKRKLI